MSVGDGPDGWRRLLRVRRGVPSPAARCSGAGGVLIAKSAAGIPAEMRDRGKAGGRGLVGPSAILGAEPSEDGVVVLVLVVGLGRGAAGFLATDSGYSGLLWEGAKSPK